VTHKLQKHCIKLAYEKHYPNKVDNNNVSDR